MREIIAAIALFVGKVIVITAMLVAMYFGGCFAVKSIFEIIDGEKSSEAIGLFCYTLLVTGITLILVWAFGGAA